LKYKPISAGNPANNKLISGAVIYVEVGIFSFRIKFHPELQIDVPLKNFCKTYLTTFFIIFSPKEKKIT
jgi:hypothetical protein